MAPLTFNDFLLNLPNQDAIRLMSSLKKLTTIEIFTHHKKDGHDHPQPIKNCMAVVREVLQKQTSGSEAKWLIINYPPHCSSSIEKIEVK